MKKRVKDQFVAAFWRLPYRQRRALYRTLQRDSFEEYQDLRAMDPSDEASLQPFDEYRCIFVHIPKCAGLSVGKSLFGHTPGSHMGAITFQLIYSEERYEDYFKFTFTRNPWDRLVSAFRFLKGGGWTDEDQEWAEANLAAYNDFDSFVRGWVTPANILSWQHFKPQTRYIYSPQGELQVDFVGRFERLEEDFAYIARRLGLNRRLPHINKSGREKRDYRSYYTPETRRIVAEVYRDDVEMLGYDFDGIRSRPVGVPAEDDDSATL